MGIKKKVEAKLSITDGANTLPNIEATIVDAKAETVILRYRLTTEDDYRVHSAFIPFANMRVIANLLNIACDEIEKEMREQMKVDYPKYDETDQMR